MKDKVVTHIVVHITVECEDGNAMKEVMKVEDGLRNIGYRWSSTSAEGFKTATSTMRKVNPRYHKEKIMNSKKLPKEKVEELSGLLDELLWYVPSDIKSKNETQNKKEI